MSGPGAERDPVVLGREVLRREAAALEALVPRLGASFTAAVECIEKAGGRVLVTGVGKSGHIGAKIAATLTSVGVPAFFLHPTEAVHGDLGLVSGDDVVLALSKSGRSAELVALLPHFRRVGTVIVAIAGSADSPLGREADHCIETGPIEEACSLDLVPTTSTTVMLALGDALAVTLLRRGGLTEEDFAFVHPGGLIGRQVGRRCRELMHRDDALPRIPETGTVREALVEIVEKGLGVTTVVDANGLLVGVLTDGDLKRILLANTGGTVLEGPVSAVMSRTPRTIEPEALVAHAVRRMEERRPGAVTSLVVVDGDRPVGVLHLHDCLRVDPAAPSA